MEKKYIEMNLTSWLVVICINEDVTTVQGVFLFYTGYKFGPWGDNWVVCDVQYGGSSKGYCSSQKIIYCES